MPTNHNMQLDHNHQQEDTPSSIYLRQRNTKDHPSHSTKNQSSGHSEHERAHDQELITQGHIRADDSIINHPSHQEETTHREESAAETSGSTIQDTSPADATEGMKTNAEEEVVDEEPLCRICLSGRDDADPSLGRFIQPCLCRGTMAFIHVGCLQRWRTTSPSPKSFYRCDQCGYRYKLRRAKIAGLAENTAILGGVTFMVFFILVIVSGFISSWLLESYSQMTTLESQWDSGLGPFSYDSTGKIVGEVVGEAVRVLNSKLHVDDTRLSRTAGTTPIRRSKLVTQAQAESQVSQLKPLQTADSEEHTYRYVRAKGGKNGQERTSEPIAVHSTRPSKRTQGTEDSWSTRKREEEESAAGESTEEPGHMFQRMMIRVLSKLEVVIKHTIKGLAFIGVMSFFQLAMSVTLFSPWNFGIRNSVLRMMRTGSASRTSSAGRAAAADPNGVGSLLILLFVLLGLLKAIQSVWKFVRNSSRWVLRKIEDGVLDVRAA